MAEKFREQAKILSQECIAPDIHSLWIRTERIAAAAVPGQFLCVYCEEESRLLPRPLSLCEIDGTDLRLVYRAAGGGTREFSEKRAGETLAVLGPLGNGFPLQDKNALLIGGGIGIPPILELAKRYPGEKTIVLGYNDRDTFLADDFSALMSGSEKENTACGNGSFGRDSVWIATTDGSVGVRGTVLDALRAMDRTEQAARPAASGAAAEVLYACGPTPMLRALKEYAAARGMPCFVSVEERMACGIGACLACVCRSAETDAHTNVRYKRVCREGPVFDAREIEL